MLMYKLMSAKTHVSLIYNSKTQKCKRKEHKQVKGTRLNTHTVLLFFLTIHCIF